MRKLSTGANGGAASEMGNVEKRERESESESESERKDKIHLTDALIFKKHPLPVTRTTKKNQEEEGGRRRICLLKLLKI